MPYQLSPNHRHQLIHLVYSGTIHFDERVEARDAVFRLCHEHGYSRALVDMSNSNIEMNQTEAVRFARRFESQNLPPNYRLAVVVKSGANSDKVVELLISLNGINVKYFANGDEALGWLTAY